MALRHMAAKAVGADQQPDQNEADHRRNAKTCKNRNYDARRAQNDQRVTKRCRRRK
jgi:hypothetical protein